MWAAIASLTFQDFMSLSMLIVLSLTLILALLQLRKSGANSRISALAQVLSNQSTISEMILTNDDLRTVAYPKSEKEDARKKIFLTLLINNSSLAYAQMNLHLFSTEQEQAFRNHLRAEFEKNVELKRRLEATRIAYDPGFVSMILDP